MNRLSDSERIAEAIGEIKRAGYDVFLVLEATIGFNKREEGEEPAEDLAAGGAAGDCGQRARPVYYSGPALSEGPADYGRRGSLVFQGSPINTGHTDQKDRALPGNSSA
jgi:hypothetical protein